MCGCSKMEPPKLQQPPKQLGRWVGQDARPTGMCVGYDIRRPDKIGSVPRIPIHREIQSNMPTTSNLGYNMKPLLDFQDSFLSI